VTRSVVAYVPDLMDRSKVQAVAGDTVVFAASPDQLAELVEPAVEVIVVDLSRAGVLDAVQRLRGAGKRVVGFGSHVDRQTLDAARRAGCHEVLTRSAFFADVAAALGWQ
jgi:DNA-binding NarL/FixJ family response regulator